MLIDSDVLVWLTRGHVGAAQRLQALPFWRISVVTYIEFELNRAVEGLTFEAFVP